MRRGDRLAAGLRIGILAALLAAGAASADLPIETIGPAEAAAGSAPFTEEEVARVRRPPLTHVGAVRRTLLEQLQADASTSEPLY